MADINLIVSTNADKVTGEFNRLGNTVLSQVKKAQQLERGYKDLDRAFNKGQISAQKYSRGIMQVDNAIKQALTGQAQLATATRRTAGAMDTMSAAQAVSTRRMGRGSVITQQAGYQVGDFLVQIQSGTNAFVAFGQQATQVAGTLTILGGKWVLIGTILGVVIPLTTALGAAMARTKTDTSFLADSLDSISPLLDSIAKAASYLKEVFLDTANVLVNNLDRMISYAVTFAGLIAGKFVVSLIAARVATMSLAGSMVFLRGALIRTGIGALIVGAGELVFQFTRLIKAAGSFGDAMALLKGAFQEQVFKMTQIGQAFVLGIQIQWRNMVDGFLTAVWDIRMAWAKTVDWISQTGPGGAFGLGIKGGNVEALEQGSWARTANRADQDAAAVRQLIAIQEAVRSATPDTEKLKELLASLGETDIDVRDWDLFSGKDKDKDKDTESALEKLRKELALMEELVGKTQEYRYVREALGDEYKNVSAETIAGLEAQYKAVQELIRLEEEHKANLQSIADVMKSSMSDAFMSMVEGTKTVGDAFKEMARLIIKQLFDVLVVQQIVGSFNVGTGTGSGIVGAIMGSFEGGGYTGSGARSGGMDGKGGFMAMLHPQETVVDHTKGQSAGGGMVVQQTLQFNFSANGDESVKRIIASEAPKIANLTQKQIMDQRRRGGSMKSTFG